MFRRDTLKNKIEDKINTLNDVPGLVTFVNDNCFVAGGAVRDIIRNRTPKDYDIFFKTEEAKDVFIKKFGTIYDFTVTGIGNYNYKNFQFITLYTGTPKQVTSTFDWNVNQVWYDFQDERTYFETGYDLYLNFDCEKPLSALMRLPYLLEKGYKISQTEHLKAIAFTALKVNFNDEESIAKQHEWMSSGGGASSPANAVWAVRKVKEEAKIRTKLYKVLK